ncbi:uncharacterized transporter slc-17.2-like isoform X1 [Haliotis rubra]|uniref:uncharacterized transporter slc-17.2-like isoform X1 n=2 Tax=Haliotis rubra TaxID=36100 RepID=UPI001EE5E986|nr:uncharacterized transporter slc-17.2-like isoform X1 [Haliotis rubra]XP_046559194.1 uncharacterized transporter slc-17.2-like isoform X1 [Haliotis rubra]
MTESTPLITPKGGKDGDVPCLCSQRWLLAYVGCFGCIMLYSARTNLSVAIVCMVNDTETNSTSPMSEHAEFYWTKGEQSGILSSYFYGYIITQIPAGILASKYGGKYVMFIGMSIGSIASLLLPIGARTSIYLVYVLRVILGVSQGVLYPSLQSMWGRWAPPLESTKLTAVCYSGNQFGNIATFAISGFMCIYGFDNGWGSIFYVTGGISLLWCGLWYITVASTPAEHPRITKRERNYIISSIGEKQTSYSTPWAALLKSPATWACLVAQVCANWISYTLLTNLPTYLKEVLDFNIAENGLLSSIPYMSQAVTGVLSGQIADFFRSRKYLSTTATRRIFQTISFVGAGACLVGTGFVGVEHRYIPIVLLTLAMGFVGMASAGYLVNTVDFAPRYAGILFGITNAAATVPGMVAPLVAGALTPNKTQEEWRNVFYVCAGFCVIGIVVFGTMARGELQPWAVDKVEVDVGEGQDDPEVSDRSLDSKDNLDKKAMIDTSNQL